MMRNSKRSSWAGILLLALLLFRAYVPAGFMPASGAPFLLELCPSATAGMPAHHLHHHPGSLGGFETCPFGAVPASGPISHHIDLALASPAPSGPIAAPKTARIALRAPNAHQPRGPPSLA